MRMAGAGEQPKDGAMTKYQAASGPSLCTVVDLNYLARAVALYRSLERVCPDFRLYIVCIEPGVRPLLERLDLQYATMIDVETLERFDPEVARVKGSRKRIEHCWPLKPVLCRYLLENVTAVDAVPYVDSDLYFFDDPNVVLD